MEPRKAGTTPAGEITLNSVRITDPFWSPRREMNAHDAILYQWEQLERAGTIDNFRLVAGITKGFRRGYFYTDSDAFKWAEAASHILSAGPNRPLEERLNEFTGILLKAQDDDGYLFTFNQLHFPGVRWVNLQIEHELYCHGHFIEAGIAHHAATGRADLYAGAVKAADLIVKTFAGATPEMTPGHEEIELALMRLYRHTGEAGYLEAARRFLDQRGRIRFFGLKLIRQNGSHTRRLREVEAQRASVPDAPPPPKIDLAMHLGGKKIPLSLRLRSLCQLLTGRYFQQHAPLRKMDRPAGHAVRWDYLVTGAAMLAEETGDHGLRQTLKNAWTHMVEKKTYLTGGIGSLHMVEGFGRDYELDNGRAYCETCAAIGSIMWSVEMQRMVREAKYADLIEWQLYNAVSPGIALDGRSYHYFNPLESEGGIERKGWYDTACCPSNISRLWASLGKYLYTAGAGDLWVHQYVGGDAAFGASGTAGPLVRAVMDSSLPWGGRVKMELYFRDHAEYTLHLRVPSWADGFFVMVDGRIEVPEAAGCGAPTAGGYSPFRARYHTMKRVWDRHSVIEAVFPMHPVFRYAHKKVKNNRRKTALTRGPLVYCLESVDNPGVRIPGAAIDRSYPVTHRYSEGPMGGMTVLEARDPSGLPLVLVPYYSWANRGPSAMQVWLNTE